MILRGEEDYIKWIYKLELNVTDYVKTKDLVDALDHAAPTVTEMIKRLSRHGFVAYKKYHGVRLTPLGRDEAEKMIQKHRLWEVFLTEYGDLSDDEVHEEAEKLEHATSDKVMQALYRLLNAPEHCPHGSPIPKLNMTLKKE